MIRKKIVLMLLSVVLALSLSGCKSKYGSIPKEDEVLKEVNRVVETENFELMRKEKIKGYPRQCVYYFESLDRELEFTAVSSLKHGRILGATTTYYVGSVKVNYGDAVADYYEEDIIKCLEQSDTFDKDKKRFRISDVEQFAEVAEVIYQADQIYAKESEYNSEYWMDHNPAMFIRINFIENGVEYRGGNIRIIGTMTKADVFAKLEKEKADVEEFRIIEDE